MHRQIGLAAAFLFACATSASAATLAGFDIPFENDDRIVEASVTTEDVEYALVARGISLLQMSNSALTNSGVPRDSWVTAGWLSNSSSVNDAGNADVDDWGFVLNVSFTTPHNLQSLEFSFWGENTVDPFDVWVSLAGVNGANDTLTRYPIRCVRCTIDLSRFKRVESLSIGFLPLGGDGSLSELAGFWSNRFGSPEFARLTGTVAPVPLPGTASLLVMALGLASVTRQRGHALAQARTHKGTARSVSKDKLNTYNSDRMLCRPDLSNS